MQNQRLFSARADPFSQGSPVHQIRCDSWILSLSNVPGHHFSAPDINHQVEVKPDPADRGGGIGDVLAPQLIRACCTKPRYTTWLLWGVSPIRDGETDRGRGELGRSCAQNRCKAPDPPTQALFTMTAVLRIRARYRQNRSAGVLPR